MEHTSLRSINRAIILSILFVVIFVLAIIGITFAFFNIPIIGNDTASSIRIDSIDLGTITFLDGDTISINNMIPLFENERPSKTFTITSTQNADNIGYAVYLKVIENTFTNNYANEFTYTLTGSSSNSGTVISSIDAEVPAYRVSPYLLGNGVLHSGGDVHTYTFTIGLNEVGSNQNSNQLKNFEGKIIVETDKYTHDHSLWE